MCRMVIQRRAMTSLQASVCTALISHPHPEAGDRDARPPPSAASRSKSKRYLSASTAASKCLIAPVESWGIGEWRLASDGAGRVDDPEIVFRGDKGRIGGHTNVAKNDVWNPEIKVPAALGGARGGAWPRIVVPFAAGWVVKRAVQKGSSRPGGALSVPRRGRHRRLAPATCRASCTARLLTPTERPTAKGGIPASSLRCGRHRFCTLRGVTEDEPRLAHFTDIRRYHNVPTPQDGCVADAVVRRMHGQKRSD